MLKIKRSIFFNGENPGMTLLDPKTEQTTAVVSYWHCTDSPHGIGHALVLWLNTEKTPPTAIGSGGVFTDNPKLAQLLVENLTQHFPEFCEVPVSTLAYINAQLSHTFDGSSYQVSCHLSETQINIEWLNLLDRKQVIWPQFPAGEAAFDLTTVICPCEQGTIQINGQQLTGTVKTSQGQDGFMSSTAFLAFSETWIGPLPKLESEQS